MVSVRKRGKVYEYRFEIATVEGTRKWITKSGYPTKAEAFNKLPKDMSDSESIMLAGIQNAPSLYNPIQNKNLAIERQRQVINKMIKYGNLDKVEAEKIIK